MSDEEVSKLLDKLVKKIISGKMKKEEVKSVELDMVGVDSPHGIYIYDRGKDKWVLVKVSGEYFKPDKDGVYVIYFDNTMCPACRIYDLSWYPYVKLFSRNLENTYFVVILCAWFAHNCKSEAARESFKHYNIKASPTTVLLCVSNGEVVEEERFEGAKKLDYLATVIDKFVERCRKHLSS